MTDVFISYAHEDVAAVRKLAEALQTAGHQVWWDHKIRGGAQFSAETATALGAAKAILVVWSAASIKSHWVADEASEGRDSGRLVPISLDGTLPPLGFRQFLSIDFSAWKGANDDAFMRLHQALGQLLGRADPLPRTPSAIKKTEPKYLAIALLGAIALAGLGYVAFTRFGGAEKPISAPRKDAYSSIAVMAFADMSEKKDQEYLADGIAEELLNGLARNPEIKVAARTSSFLFKGKSTPVQEIASALNVETILEGSVRKSGSRLRITAQLIDAATGYHLWSESFDRTIDDVFAIQDEISATIVSQLNSRLKGAKPEYRTSNVAAYEAYLEAQYEVANRRTIASLQRAMLKYAEAITLDPKFGVAYARLARAHLLASERQWGNTPHRTALSEARRCLRMATQLAGDALETRRSSALLAEEEGARTQALAELERIVNAYPESAAAHHAFARGSMLMLKVSQALKYAKKSLELDPLGAEPARIYGLTLAALGRPEDSIPTIVRARKYNPDSLPLADQLFRNTMYTGNFSGALEPLIRFADDEPDNRVANGDLAINLALLGLQNEAIALAGDERSRLSVSELSGLPIDLQDYPGLASSGDDDAALAGRLYMLAGDYAKAGTRFEEFLRQNDMTEAFDLSDFAAASYAFHKLGRHEAAQALDLQIEKQIRRAFAAGVVGLQHQKAAATAAAARGDDAEVFNRLGELASKGGGLMSRFEPSFLRLHGNLQFEKIFSKIDAHRARERQKAIDAGLIDRIREIIAARSKTPSPNN